MRRAYMHDEAAKRQSAKATKRQSGEAAKRQSDKAETKTSASRASDICWTRKRKVRAMQRRPALACTMSLGGADVDALGPHANCARGRCGSSEMIAAGARGLLGS